jgi:hypothetical protein
VGAALTEQQCLFSSSVKAVNVLGGGGGGASGKVRSESGLITPATTIVSNGFAEPSHRSPSTSKTSPIRRSTTVARGKACRQAGQDKYTIGVFCFCEKALFKFWLLPCTRGKPPVRWLLSPSWSWPSDVIDCSVRPSIYNGYIITSYSRLFMD